MDYSYNYLRHILFEAFGVEENLQEIPRIEKALNSGLIKMTDYRKIYKPYDGTFLIVGLGPFKSIDIFYDDQFYKICAYIKKRVDFLIDKKNTFSIINIFVKETKEMIDRLLVSKKEIDIFFRPDNELYLGYIIKSMEADILNYLSSVEEKLITEEVELDELKDNIEGNVRGLIGHRRIQRYIEERDIFERNRCKCVQIKSIIDILYSLYSQIETIKEYVE